MFSALRRGLAAQLQWVLDRVQQVTSGQGVRRGRQVCRRSLRHNPSAALAGTGADVDDVVGAAYGVFVMLDHHQRVAALAQFAQGAQQDLVVTRMQADGRLVQHIANALQIAAQLRGQPDALRLAARERGRTTVQRQVAQAHVFEKLQPALDFRHQVAGDLGVAAREL